MLRLTTTLGAASLALPATQAMLVAPGSPCSTSCSNVLDSTAPDELACAEGSYAAATGKLFQGCVVCEMRSAFHADNRSDVQSMLCRLFASSPMSDAAPCRRRRPLALTLHARPPRQPPLCSLVLPLWQAAQPRRRQYSLHHQVQASHPRHLSPPSLPGHPLLPRTRLTLSPARPVAPSRTPLST